MKQKKSKMTAKKYDATKTMDVSKPGKTTPDTSARPVIITNRSMVQDPTLTDKSQNDGSKPTEATVARGAKTVSPVSKSSEDDSVKSADQPKPEPEEPDTQKAQAKEAAVVEAVADQATEDKKKQNKDSDVDIARRVELEKLITDKKFFVPIGQVGKRRNRRTLIVFLVILLLLAAFYLLADAGAIKLPFTLPFDLIPNQPLA